MSADGTGSLPETNQGGGNGAEHHTQAHGGAGEADAPSGFSLKKENILTLLK